MVVAMPKAYDVPATGTVEYTRFILPLNFTEDRWVSAAEVRPGNRAVVHHVIAYLREPGSVWLKGAPIGEPVVKAAKSDGGPRSSLGGYAPGVPQRPGTPGRALRVKAGSEVVLEMHYTTNGKPATDLTKVGIIFATEPPSEIIGGFAAGDNKFVIPPGAEAHDSTTGALCVARIAGAGDKSTDCLYANKGYSLSSSLAKRLDAHTVILPLLRRLG